MKRLFPSCANASWQITFFKLKRIPYLYFVAFVFCLGNPLTLGLTLLAVGDSQGSWPAYSHPRLLLAALVALVWCCSQALLLRWSAHKGGKSSAIDSQLFRANLPQGIALFLGLAIGFAPAPINGILLMILGMTGLLLWFPFLLTGCTCFLVTNAAAKNIGGWRYLGKTILRTPAFAIYPIILILVVMICRNRPELVIGLMGKTMTCDISLDQQVCFSRLAHELENPSMCSNINDHYGKHKCWDKLIATPKSPLTCQRFKDVKFPLDRINNQDLKTCFDLFPSSAELRDFCDSTWKNPELKLLLNSPCVDQDHINIRFGPKMRTILMQLLTDGAQEIFDSYKSYLEIMKLKPNLNTQDIDGNTVLHLVLTKYAKYDEALQFLSSGANPKILNNEQQSALILWAQAQPNFMPPHFMTMKLLKAFTEKGGDINAQDIHGDTFMHKFFQAQLKPNTILTSKHIEDIRRIVQMGFNPDIKNKVGESSRDLAQKSGNGSVFDDGRLAKTAPPESVFDKLLGKIPTNLQTPIAFPVRQGRGPSPKVGSLVAIGFSITQSGIWIDSSRLNDLWIVSLAKSSTLHPFIKAQLLSMKVGSAKLIALPPSEFKSIDNKSAAVVFSISLMQMIDGDKFSSGSDLLGDVTANVLALNNTNALSAAKRLNQSENTALTRRYLLRLHDLTKSKKPDSPALVEAEKEKSIDFGKEARAEYSKFSTPLQD
ncbi:MAG: hypothetical protein AB7F86_19005 [Bdellovibrionales bacterium]